MTKMIFLALYVGYVTQTKQLATDTKNKETIEHYLTTVKSCIVEYQSIICYHWFFKKAIYYKSNKMWFHFHASCLSTVSCLNH